MNVNWNQRSYEKELLDREDIPFDDIKKNMQELNIINTRLGGHAITVKGLKRLLGSKLFQNPIPVMEVGCGGGDNLRVLKAWAARNNRHLKLTGVDINEACIRFAKEQPGNDGIHFICADYKTVSLQQQVIFSSLFCHHFTDEELTEMLQWMRQNTGTGFFINDLHRHPLAYYSIKALTQLFSKSYLVKNDAPLSVRRGFTERDWTQLFQKANIQQYHIQWQWAFRWLVTYRT
jgi:2-polyprenyl-3-methyl-5-hydroxy-6-metoxy-1,4-benzoquinol methylase